MKCKSMCKHKSVAGAKMTNGQNGRFWLFTQTVIRSEELFVFKVKYLSNGQSVIYLLYNRKDWTKTITLSLTQNIVSLSYPHIYIF